MDRKGSFAFLDSVELFVRTGTFHADVSKNSRSVTRAASKQFMYKDGCLWRTIRGRLLRVVRTEEEVREILTRYHDNNNHAGQGRTVKEILMMYYWAGVRSDVKKWIKACALCQSLNRADSYRPHVHSCLAYSCEATSYIHPELTFHRFPKDAELRQKWLAVAQRDEGSLRTNSFLCSKHFGSSCFMLNEEGLLTLSPDAVPTISPVGGKGDEVPVHSDEDILNSKTLEELLSITDADTTDPMEQAVGRSGVPAQLQEHQYCLPAPNPYSRATKTARADKPEKTSIEPCFRLYDQIERYLSHRVLPLQCKKKPSSFRRTTKRFDLTDGVLVYTRVSPAVRVVRSREEANSILQQFHDNQGHAGQRVCQKQITNHFYWRSLTEDLAGWIASCHTCGNRTKRMWLRCSIYSCTNCCGPVERGLGLTFHKFPLHNSALLAQWMKSVGRPNWHPRLRSSICSTHFTEDCFDRAGDVVTLRPDAVPTLFVHREAAAESSGPTQPAAGEEAYFAKFDAVELYLRRRIYPPGLSYVEKNTFRRFCKRFALKDDQLHMVKSDQARLVLRSRQQVDVALNDYHNELNHLDVSKCLRLLSERFFWKTMRPDVVQWINKCSQCNKKKMNKPESHKGAGGSESLLQTLSGRSDDEDECSDGDEGSESPDEEPQPEEVVVDFSTSVCAENPSSTSSPQSVTRINPQLGASVVLRLKAPNSVQSRTSNSPFVARLVKMSNPPQPESQHSQTEPEERTETSRSQGSARTHRCIPDTEKGGTRPLTESRSPPELRAKLPKQPPDSGLKAQSTSHTSAQAGGSHSVQRPAKRRSVPEAGPSSKRSSSSGLEPVVAPSTKPWPVFTISSSIPAQSAPEVHSPAPVHRPRVLQARTIIQQCTQAKVKIKPALDGLDAQWAEIQQGVVVYVCFFDGATEDVAYEMANSLMTTRFFRKGGRHNVSLLDLPGSALFIPQDSLAGKRAPQKKVQYKGVCEPWLGAQLFSRLVSTCMDLMSDSLKCKKAGVKVERGVYGQKQELVLNSLEPLTVLLDF